MTAYAGPGSRQRATSFAKAAVLFAITLTLTWPVCAQESPAKEGDDFRSLLNDGFALHQRADYANALPLLERARSIHPRDYFANLLIGVELLRTGKPEEAIDYLQVAAHQRPREDFPLDYMGEAQAQLGHFAEAAQSYSRAVEVAPTSSQAIEGALDYAVERFRLISAELRSTSKGLAAEYRLQAMSRPLGDPGREQLLLDAARMDPEAPGIWSDLAIAYLRTGKKQGAEKSLAQSLKRNPNDLRARQAEAMLAATRGDWNAAFADVDFIVERSPGALAESARDWPQNLQPPSDRRVTGAAAAFLVCAREKSNPCNLEKFGHERRRLPVSRKVLYQQERWEQLISLPVLPNEDATAWFQYGSALADLGRWGTAIPALERSMKGGGNNVYALFLLGWSYAEQAGKVMALLEQEHGDEAVTHLIRGDVLLQMQANSQGAIAEYTTALRIRAGDPKLVERLAEAQFENGQPKDAVESAKAALSIDPYQFAAMQTLARIAIAQRRYDDALPYLSQLTAHDPKDIAAQVEFGMVLAQTGDANEALKHLGPPLERGYPDEKGSLHALLGTVLRKVGRNEEAAQAFAKARTLSDEYQRKAHQGADEQN